MLISSCALVCLMVRRCIGKLKATHVRTVHLVWIVFAITHANVQQDIRVVTVKRVGFFVFF